MTEVYYTPKVNVRYRRDLWRLIDHLPIRRVAEIGVAEGYFSAEMLAWPIQPMVFMVDRWKETPSVKGDSSNPQSWHDKNLQQALERVAPFGLFARVLRGESVEMAKCVEDASLSLVYVDGDHSYEGVKADIRAWLPKLTPGGVMAFHDFEAPQYGVKQAVTEYCQRHGCPLYHLPEDKPEDAGAYFYADPL